MDLNYNFTKRFKSSFKNKVRITAGLIVTMLITGNLAMARNIIPETVNYGTETESIDIGINYGIAKNSEMIYYNHGLSEFANVIEYNIGTAKNSDYISRNYGLSETATNIESNYGTAKNSDYISRNYGLSETATNIESNYGIAKNSESISSNYGMSVVNGVVSSSEEIHTSSGYAIPLDSLGYIYNANVNVTDKNTAFEAEILDTVKGVSSQSKLIEATNFSGGIHQEGTINILENTGGLSDGEIFVGLNLGESGSLYNRGNFNVASLNGADVIGVYHGGYSTGDYSNYNSHAINISTEGHGIAYYYSDGGSLNNEGIINADTAIVMTSAENNNTLANYGIINGDVLMNTAGTNKVMVGGIYYSNMWAVINGDITFSGGGDNYLNYSNANVAGTGNIYGDGTGYNEISVSGGYDIAKNIYDFNVLKVTGGNTVTLSKGYGISMNPQEIYTEDDIYSLIPYSMALMSDDTSDSSTGLTINGTLTLNTELSGSGILVPKIKTSGGDITVSETGKIKFYVSGTGIESTYDIIFGGDLTTTNVVSDGNLVAGDGTLEYSDELFSETLGWNVTNIDESGTQTVVTLTGKDVYDELRETTQENNKTKIINILEDDQDRLGIHEALSNVAMEDAEKAVTELNGEMYSSLSSDYIQRNKMFKGKISSMMSSPLTLGGKRQSDFALLLENSTAELSSDTFTLSPNYSFLEGEEKYIQHFDILGTTGSNDKTGVEYDTHASGFVGITEKVTGKNSSVGLSYGYFDARNDYDDGSDAETETFHLGMTHKLYFGNEYMLASHLGAEYSKNDVTREITTLGLQATSDYDSYSVSIGSDLSKNIKLSERVTLVPSIGAGYSRIERESFTESGSIGLAALDVEKQGLDSVTSRIGLRLDTDLTDKIVWFVGGSWEHEYADLNKDQEASFRGDANAESFKIKGTNIDEDTYSIMTGVNFNVNDSLTYRIMYSFTQQDDLGENNIDLGVSWKF